jgi:dTMP kinase|tara:strand:+ start:700 stop:993 length:294 start_codon:yes stop_codon:yes gene_type:complete
MPEVGLPSPDVVLFLDMSIEQAKERGQFGEERYEKEEFQRTVRKRFQELMETENSKVPWCVIDAARTIEEVEQDVHRHAEETIARVDEGALPVGTLW